MNDGLYEYIGQPGGFVPGLPQRITKKQAIELGVDDLLESAIMAGNYAIVEKKSRSIGASTGKSAAQKIKGKED